MGTQVVGPHVIGFLVVVQQVDVAVGFHRSGIVVIVERRQRHVAVDPVPFLLVGILRDVVVEDRRIVIQIKRKLGVIEVGIFLDCQIVSLLGSLLEGLHRRHLVPGLDVAVAQLIIGDLADRIGPFLHKGIIVDRSGEIIHRVEERAGIEEIVSIHVPAAPLDPIVIFPGLRRISGCQE